MKSSVDRWILVLGRGLVVFLMVFGGWQLYSEVLPYHFSGQRHFPLVDGSGMYDASDAVGVFHGQTVRSDPDYGKELADTRVLGSSDEAVEKRIEVDLTNQKLYAVEDGKKIASFDVSTGLWGKTPTGTFKIWIKLVRTKMSGGSKALRTYYYLPNVPYTMFFYNDETPKHLGFGIHGAYWHSNFGEPMSHGCVNMRTRDAEKLFYWASPESGEKSTVYASEEDPGTEVVIYAQDTQI